MDNPHGDNCQCPICIYHKSVLSDSMAEMNRMIKVLWEQNRYMQDELRAKAIGGDNDNDD